MDEKKFLNLTGLSSFLANLKKIFATSAQGAKADEAYIHAESAHAPSNAERNVIIGIKKNGSDLTPDSSRKVNITVPTKVSELSNDSGYKTTDHNTTYSLSKSGSTIKLTGSDGSETSVTDSNTTYQNATTSTDGLMSSEDKTKLNGIATGANKYTLPTASSSTLGGVKTTSSVTSTSGLTPCPIISGVPYYKDTNTTYTLSSFGITATAQEINYLDGVTSSVQTQLNGKASSGHNHGNASTSASGFLRQLDGSTSHYLRGDGSWGTPPNTTYSNMTGASSSTAGKTGLVPAPSAGASNRYLRSDGTWAVPPDTNTTYTLGSFGITATAAELNYVDGVTSNIQTQLNSKAATSHTHNYAGSSSSGGAANSVKTSMVIKLNGGTTEGTNMFTFNGATAKSVNITASAIGAASSSHNHSASNITSGTLPVGRGGTGITSNPSMLINLASTSAASVFAASPRPGVTGTLPIARGGTGGTSAASARLQLGVVNIVCSETEPTGQNVGDIWLQEL